MNTKFFVCPTCGQVIGVIKDKGVPIHCCGKPMEELTPNTTDASQEKHVPVVNVDGSTLTVTVGSVEHPMEVDHYIEWIYVKTENGGQRRALKPGDAPKAEFCICNDKAIAVYAYCNLHGLWMTEI